ncbi:MAG: hypothetical protein ABI882_04270 [Acidobacteriota bacterium]
MTRTRITICLLLLITYSQLGNRVHAQVSDFPSRLLGQWIGEGKTMGMDSRPTMRWERVLANKFVHLHFRNEIKNGQGKVEIFEGHAYYKATGGGNFSANWFDSGGAAHPIQAVFADNALTSKWGTEQTEMGITTYRLVDDNSVEIVDQVRRKDGTWREFSRTLLKRS